MSATNFLSKGSEVRRKADGLIGEIYAVDSSKGIVTVRWKAGRRFQTLICTLEQFTEYWDVTRLGSSRSSVIIRIFAGVFIFISIVCFMVAALTNSGSSTPQNSIDTQVQQQKSEGEITSNVAPGIEVIQNSQELILELKTNLPPKTNLMATIVNPINQGGDGYDGQAQAEVQNNQIARFGPFSNDGNRLLPGIYVVSISSIMAALQPKEVQQYIGEHGERLTGSSVMTLPGTQEKIFWQTFKFKLNPDGSASSQLHNDRNIDSVTHTPPQSIAQIMAIVERLNDMCRDGLGNDNATQKVCNERDGLVQQLQAENWCWGHDGQIGADRTWEPCQNKK